MNLLYWPITELQKKFLCLFDVTSKSNFVMSQDFWESWSGSLDLIHFTRLSVWQNVCNGVALLLILFSANTYPKVYVVKSHEYFKPKVNKSSKTHYWEDTEMKIATRRTWVVLNPIFWIISLRCRQTKPRYSPYYIGVKFVCNAGYWIICVNFK